MQVPIIVINGRQHVHISDFAKMTGKSIPGIRNLYLNGNMIRKLQGKRISRGIYIELDEFYIYPFLPGGRPEVRKSVYHYDENGIHICQECTDGQRCPLVNDDGCYMYTQPAEVSDISINVGGKHEDDSKLA